MPALTLPEYARDLNVQLAERGTASTAALPAPRHREHRGAGHATTREY